MNVMQRLVLVLFGVGAPTMLLYPPFHFSYPNGVIDNLGYHYLFDPPIGGSSFNGSVNVPLLVAQFLVLTILCGVAWLLAGASRSNRREPVYKRTKNHAVHKDQTKEPTLVGSEEAEQVGPTLDEGVANQPALKLKDWEFDPVRATKAAQENLHRAVDSGANTKPRTLKAVFWIALILTSVMVSTYVAWFEGALQGDPFVVVAYVLGRTSGFILIPILIAGAVILIGRLFRRPISTEVVYLMIALAWIVLVASSIRVAEFESMLLDTTSLTPVQPDAN